jgi:glycerol uptake facilitator-like aquaporin
MLFEVLAIWGCLPEWNSTTYECANFDMSNAASTWVGLIVGALIGAAITWWIYNRQKKISDKQDEIFLMYIGHLEESHGRILEKISTLDEKIDSILERR